MKRNTAPWAPRCQAVYCVAPRARQPLSPPASLTRLASTEPEQDSSNPADKQQDIEDSGSQWPSLQDKQQQNKQQHQKAKRQIGNLSNKDEHPQPPRPPHLPPRLQYLLLLLTQFGGVYGTAAVVVAWFTQIDPFGGLCWNADHILYGLQTFLPLLVLDALLMLPDYSIRPEDSQAVAELVLGDPDAIRNWGETGLTVTAAVDEHAAADGSSKDTISTSGSSGSSAGSTSSSIRNTFGSLLLRVRLALELLQQIYTKANPGAGLSPVSELFVVCVASLADEMLYRAVGLTLLGLWIRDRLYEGGADEIISWDLWTGQHLEYPTPDFARFAAVGVIALLGIGGFVAGALKELDALRRLQVLDKDGVPSEAAQALKTQLVASLRSQNLVMYGVEGVREVTASVMAGTAFVTTSNLAAPLAGSLVVQTLFSIYQRLSLDRARNKRQEMLERMKQRSNKLTAAMEAALAARQASPAAAGGAATTSADAAAVIPVGRISDNADEGDDGSSAHSSSDSGDEQEVDFLTAVLDAAQKQQQQQRLQQQQHHHTGVGEPTTSVADWSEPSRSTAEAANSHSAHAAASSQHHSLLGNKEHSMDVSSSTSSSHTGQQSSSDSGSDASSSSGSHKAAAEAARQQLSVLLEDMLKSPEGTRVVQLWLNNKPTGTSSSDSGSSSIADKDPQKAVEQLLSDPETKAHMLRELEDQLCAVSERRQRRRKQNDDWRQ
eukprot:GHRR01006573.1.p1 GENE.GHRR01006573.1~~GHRR01006573.1.p1  ORF type:complete len:720 (+),score=349.27 GHRR01006573.1:621-2780(+)